jgi:ADP-heptose:LPS heptosyltransferase
VARPSLHVDNGLVTQALQELREQAPHAERFVCFNTGASGRWEEKKWKPHCYAQLADLIESHGPDAAIVLTGGPEESGLNRELCARRPAFIDGGTDNSVTRFAALVAACEWVLTGDSLGYHVACATGTPALCLVGPTSPWELDTFATNRVVHASLDCIACYLPRCPLSRTCMDALTPELIWDHVNEWTSHADARRPIAHAQSAEPTRASSHVLHLFTARTAAPQVEGAS